MRISIFTSTQPRHVALIEAMTRLSDDVHAVMECKTLFPGKVGGVFPTTPTVERYFERVIAAEEAVFGGPRFLPKSARALMLQRGDINHIDLEILAPALDADLIVVFGASYIKGDLLSALVKRQALNIHMGVSPYFRGMSCNFWALHDGRPDLVGATIHRLSKGLDSGAILYHALPPASPADPFILGMNAVRAAQESLVDRIEQGSLSDIEPIPQDSAAEIRYSRSTDFTDDVLDDYMSRLPTSEEIGAALMRRNDALFIRHWALPMGDVGYVTAARN